MTIVPERVINIDWGEGRNLANCIFFSCSATFIKKIPKFCRVCHEFCNRLYPQTSSWWWIVYKGNSGVFPNLWHAANKLRNGALQHHLHSCRVEKINWIDGGIVKAWPTSEKSISFWRAGYLLGGVGWVAAECRKMLWVSHEMRQSKILRRLQMLGIVKRLKTDDWVQMIVGGGNKLIHTYKRTFTQSPPESAHIGCFWRVNIALHVVFIKASLYGEQEHEWLVLNPPTTAVFGLQYCNKRADIAFQLGCQLRKYDIMIWHIDTWNENNTRAV